MGSGESFGNIHETPDLASPDRQRAFSGLYISYDDFLAARGDKAVAALLEEAQRDGKQVEVEGR